MTGVAPDWAVLDEQLIYVLTYLTPWLILSILLKLSAVLLHMGPFERSLLYTEVFVIKESSTLQKMLSTLSSLVCDQTVKAMLQKIYIKCNFYFIKFSIISEC